MRALPLTIVLFAGAVISTDASAQCRVPGYPKPIPENGSACIPSGSSGGASAHCYRKSNGELGIDFRGRCNLPVEAPATSRPAEKPAMRYNIPPKRKLAEPPSPYIPGAQPSAACLALKKNWYNKHLKSGCGKPEVHLRDKSLWQRACQPLIDHRAAILAKCPNLNPKFLEYP
jgi:hypothetical protein